ncbi:MAG: hypothetical protein NDI61_10195 [Bdellovibrionaceae bacterium]|nr:hypothetical protein [Pseudobdellovibrionaceae bacterium]
MKKRSNIIRMIKGNQGAAALTLVIISLVVVSILIFGAIETISTMQRTFSSAYISTKSTTSIVQGNLMSILRHSATWDNIVNSNPSLDCIKNHTACPISPSEIQRVRVESIDIIETTNPNLGYSLGGDVCMTYTDPADLNCVFKPRIQWEPICTSPCIDPAVRILVDLQPKAQLIETYHLNPENLKFSEPK